MRSLCLLLGCNLSYIVDLFAALHELASSSARTLLKLASSVRALLKPYEDTLRLYMERENVTWPLLRNNFQTGYIVGHPGQIPAGAIRTITRYNKSPCREGRAGLLEDKTRRPLRSQEYCQIPFFPSRCLGKNGISIGYMKNILRIMHF